MTKEEKIVGQCKSSVSKELEALKCLNFLKNEAINDIACLKNSVTTKTLYQLYFANFDVIEKSLQRLEAIDNSKPNEAMKKLEMLSDCAEAMKEAPSSNWIEYASSETELDYKLWRAYEDLKQYILKAQEQEKVLEIIKEKNVLIYNLKIADNSIEYNRWVDDESSLTQEEFDLLKRYCNEQNNK